MSFPTNAGSAAIFVLEISFKATFLFGAAWAAAFALRKRSAALRHELWLAAIVASLVLPVVATILPAWHSGVLGSAVERFAGPVSSARPGMAVSSFVVSAVARPSHAPLWPGMLVLVWFVGLVIATIRLAAGFVRAAELRMRSKHINDEHWIRDARRTAAALRISRPIQMLESADPAAMPLVWGLFRPKVLLPISARHWTEDRRRIVLSHELTHIARHDCAAQICGDLARGLFWFNPLAWLAAARLRRESESACDDSVLNSGVAPQSYADNLLDLARSLATRNHRWLPALAMAGRTNFERRITAMLKPLCDRRASSQKSKLFISLAAVLLLLPLAAVRLAAQNSPSAFSGTIYGPDGAATANATVMVIDVRADMRNMTTSGGDGRFDVTGLPPGEYEFQVMKLGCQTYDLPNVVIRAGETRSLNVNLESGTPREIPAPPRAIRLGGDLQQGKLFASVPPKYPAAAKSQGIAGNVVLHAFIAKDGTIKSLLVTNSPNPLLARSAVEAVSHWRYRPTLLNEQPIGVDTDITVAYSLHP